MPTQRSALSNACKSTYCYTDRCAYASYWPTHRESHITYGATFFTTIRSTYINSLTQTKSLYANPN